MPTTMDIVHQCYGDRDIFSVLHKLSVAEGGWSSIEVSLGKLRSYGLARRELIPEAIHSTDNRRTIEQCNLMK